MKNRWKNMNNINYKSGMYKFIKDIILEHPELDTQPITYYLIDQGTITDVAWSKIVFDDFKNNAWEIHNEIAILHKFDPKKVQRIVVFPKKYKNIVLISYDKNAFDIYKFNMKEIETLSNIIDLYPKNLDTVLRVHNSKSDRYYYDLRMHTILPYVCKVYDKILEITE